MSRLYYTEEGRVLPSLCEELTTYRRARKTLTLPATAHPGRVYILARSHGGQSGPLRVSLNGNAVAALEAIAQGVYWPPEEDYEATESTSIDEKTFIEKDIDTFPVQSK